MKKIKTILSLALVLTFMLAFVPVVHSAGYAYNVTALEIVDLTGKPCEYSGGSCMVRTSIKKNYAVQDGYVIIMGYSSSGTLLSLNFLQATFDVGKTVTFGASISPTNGEALGKIKVTVWNNLTAMTPLAEVATLVPGETFVPPELPAPSATTLDGSLVTAVNTVSGSKAITAGTASYKLSDDAKLYVNDVEFCDIDSLNTNNVLQLLKISDSDIRLIESATSANGEYSEVKIDIYATASITQVRVVDKDVTLLLDNYCNPVADITGTTDNSRMIVMPAQDISSGTMSVSVTKAGTAISPSALADNDIIAVKFDMTASLSEATNLTILATDEKITDRYVGMHTDGLYRFGETDYVLSPTLNPSWLALGRTYICRLDPFGRIITADEDEDAINYAIVERVRSKNESNKGYPYMSVVTLDGTPLELELYNDRANEIIHTLNSISFDTNGDAEGGVVNVGNDFDTAAKIPPQYRVISYRTRSDGTVNEVTIYIPNSYDKTVVTFDDLTYNALTSKLGSNKVSANATVLNATEYYDNNFTPYSMSQIIEDTEYNGFLIHRNNEGSYNNVVLVTTGPLYHHMSDFAVAAENADRNSMIILDDADVYTLKIADLELGEKTLYISFDAKIYCDDNSYYYDEYCSEIKKGATFFYTTNADGYVDRIDLVYKGGKTFADVVRGGENRLIHQFSSDAVNNNWKYEVNPTWAYAKSEIQLFFAPVLSKTDTDVIFGEVSSDFSYIDTTVEYSFMLNSDSKLYGINVSSGNSEDWNIFKGSFLKIPFNYVSADGYAYITSAGAEIPEYEYDLDGLFQMALVMAVDGVVTNALIFNN